MARERNSGGRACPLGGGAAMTAGKPVRAVLEEVSAHLHAMQRRGVPRDQIRRALGLSDAVAQAFGLGRPAPTPDPYGSDPRRRASAARRRRTPRRRRWEGRR